eukprot:CAMPEP_0172889308 /NCGR_PEP_ID=MMETSP1075-20121228/138473_1 /TAXON_ID=2916 /ORGANISM="Ceratium fusus, Strain PA161109" /LENGTH=81 /DNA_ID=CAMNT_0013743325 /DNA_START=94 /DNA_END=336 /DNA_ORIENTATION=-
MTLSKSRRRTVAPVSVRVPYRSENFSNPSSRPESKHDTAESSRRASKGSRNLKSDFPKNGWIWRDRRCSWLPTDATGYRAA